HHHARPAAERAVVDPAVVALCVVAGIPAVHRHQPALDRAPDHAEAGAAGDEVREQRDHVDAHGQKSGSQSTTMVPAARSMSRTKSGRTNGIMRSRPSSPPFTTT